MILVEKHEINETCSFEQQSRKFGIDVLIVNYHVTVRFVHSHHVTRVYYEYGFIRAHST